MKIQKEITLEQCQELILNYNEVGYYPGRLLDNYLLYDWQSDKYIIIQEQPLNTWSSVLIATKTDSKTLVDEFFKNQDEVLKMIND